MYALILLLWISNQWYFNQYVDFEEAKKIKSYKQ